MAATDGSNLITFQYLANGNQSFHFDVIQCLIWYIIYYRDLGGKPIRQRASLLLTVPVHLQPQGSIIPIGFLGGFNLKNRSISGLLTKRKTARYTYSRYYIDAPDKPSFRFSST